MTRIVIGLALALALPLSGGSMGAQAEGIAPEKAAETLARAWMIDNRCNVLGTADRDALTGFVARAELSLARMKSVAAARNAIANGRASGTAAPCDADNARRVNETLAMARSAAAGLDTDAASPSALPPSRRTEERGVAAAAKPAAAKAVGEAPATTPERASVAGDAPAQTRRKGVRRASASRPEGTRTPSASSGSRSGAIAGYAATAERYFRELRCRTRPLSSIKRLYAKVLRQHREAVAADGKAAVRAMLRGAEKRAAKGPC